MTTTTNTAPTLAPTSTGSILVGAGYPSRPCDAATLLQQIGARVLCEIRNPKLPILDLDGDGIQIAVRVPCRRILRKVIIKLQPSDNYAVETVDISGRYHENIRSVFFVENVDDEAVSRVVLEAATR